MTWGAERALLDADDNGFGLVGGGVEVAGGDVEGAVVEEGGGEDLAGGLGLGVCCEVDLPEGFAIVEIEGVDDSLEVGDVDEAIGGNGRGGEEGSLGVVGPFFFAIAYGEGAGGAVGGGEDGEVMRYGDGGDDAAGDIFFPVDGAGSEVEGDDLALAGDFFGVETDGGAADEDGLAGDGGAGP